MTEDQWLACTNALKMLQFLGDLASERKLRLYSLACYGRVAGHVRDDRSREAAAFAARHAEDGVARRRGLPSARERASRAWQEADAAVLRSRHGWGHSRAAAACWAADLARYTVHGDARYLASHCSLSACMAAGYASGPARRGEVPESYQLAFIAERAALADLLRDIFGPLAFRPVTVPPACLTPQVVALAQAAYEERLLPSGHLDTARLAVLADGLQDTGCDDAELLGHLRGGGVHVRGCWGVDAVLGRQ